MSRKVSLYDAKTHLSSYVDAAAAGDEVVICKNGVPKARLVAACESKRPRQPSGEMKITYIADDFDAFDPQIAKLFEGGFERG